MCYKARYEILQFPLFSSGISYKTDIAVSEIQKPYTDPCMVPLSNCYKR